MTELAKQYDPREAQQKWLPFWEEHGFFQSRPDTHREPFCIVIPPPNVTGALHMGHALNNTLQDTLIRFQRMRGRNALYMPGTDHAGIATQAVVERLIFQQEQKTRHDLGRDALVERIWQWKDRYEQRILKQLRELGCSCDWTRTRFTLDDVCAGAVRQFFFDLFKDGLVYRGKRLVNWDAHLQTSVSDDELNNIDQEGEFYYFKYPFADGKTHDGLAHVLIATTRPETMLGDTAVAVHPEPAREFDKRAQQLRADLDKASDKEKKELQDRLAKLEERKETMLPLLEKLAKLAAGDTYLQLPLVGRKIKLIADRYADPEKGTGAVKITPAHDFNDYEVGSRHPEIGAPLNILQSDGKINEVGQGRFADEPFTYVGLDRFEARTKIVADLEKLGLLDRIEKVKNTIPLSDRSKTPIEPYLSDQWFVKMDTLAESAMGAVRSGRVKFTPERYAKTYLDWLGEKRDWCISRQLWWGHRIPIWYCRCSEADLKKAFADRDDVAWRLDEENAQWLICALTDLPADAVSEKYPLEQDPDVLDTWFSSALWPHSTLGWPQQTPELGYYYPTSVLITSRDIITLWVARMVMAGLFNCQNIPFHNVYIHPKILDGFGEVMSKSKGNGVDPLDIIERYGTDALRFTMVHLATETQDSRLPVANVCPHCDALVPIKEEHMDRKMRRPRERIKCASCKKEFRPGGPWDAEHPDLPTARQAAEKFEMGRNFANKLWNAARFLLMNLEGYSPQALKIEELPIEDRWMLSRLASTARSLTEQLEGFRFSEAARFLYDFIWSEYCDWYVEMMKGRLRAEGEERATAQRVVVGVFDAILRLIQPIMPFVAESIWQVLNEAAFERGLPRPEPAAESVVIAPWPQFPADWHDAATETRIARMQTVVRFLRDARARYMIDPKRALEVRIRARTEIAADFEALAPFLKQLGGIGTLECGPAAEKPRQSATHVDPDFEIYVSLEGLIDPAAEIKRLEKQLAEKQKFMKSTQAKLENPAFRDKAPAEVVQQQRDVLADLNKQIEAIKQILEELKAAE